MVIAIKMKHLINILFVALLSGLPLTAMAQSYVKLKEISRIEGQREDALIGYGLVVGLAGSGDSRRNNATIKSISNTLRKFDLIVANSEINSRNVAAVMVTGKISSFAEKGDKIDVSVSAIGDARSLVGGTLLLTPLEAVDGNLYALAQGQISVGGYKFEQFGNVEQKNHPTVGLVPKGATVERSSNEGALANNDYVGVILKDADFNLAIKVVDQMIEHGLSAEVVHPGKIRVNTSKLSGNELFRTLAKIENFQVETEPKYIVVVNERTGTIVSGGNVKVDSISVAHGNLELSIDTKYNVNQPNNIFLREVDGSQIRSVVVPETNIEVEEEGTDVASFSTGTTVFVLVKELRKLGLSTRDIIVVLQAADKAGSLNGELILQ